GPESDDEEVAVERAWLADPRPARREQAPGPAKTGHSLLAELPPPPEELVVRTVEDDRDHLREGDRVLLIIEDDVKFARIMLGMAREKGFKAVVATRGDTGLALANELLPAAITLDIQLPVVDGWSILDRLKRNPRTRHIPVHVISIVEKSQKGAAMGAFSYLEKPVSKEALEGAISHIAQYVDKKVKNLLLVEDDEHQANSIVELIGEGEDLKITVARSGAET